MGDSEIHRIERLPILDGLRGISILLVVAFHYLARWTPEFNSELMPYGASFAFPLATDGRFGVYLFFILSGFVIARSLKSSKSWLNFATKRADRLVLPMIVLSTITLILLSGPLITDGMAVSWVDILPSWTFTAPAFWSWVSPDPEYIDGVYWTLFAEVRFYLLISLCWFFVTKRTIVGLMASLAIGGVLLNLILESVGSDVLGKAVSLVLLPQYLCIFVSGVVYSEIVNVRKPVWQDWALLSALFLAALMGVHSELAVLAPRPSLPFWLLVFNAAFVVLIYRPSWLGIFKFGPLVFLGTISYSLYLVHQGVGVAMLSRLPDGLNSGVYGLAVRRQIIWLRLGGRLAECWPRRWVDVMRRACGAASADAGWSVV